MSSFDLCAVNRAIAGTRFSGAITHLSTTGSTNTLAIKAAQAGAREGVWVADEQTSGRGRGGHTWHSAAGEGLYVSALVVPSVAASRALWIALATALAARKAVAQTCGLTPDIRWPNDLLLNGRKCGGILVESALSAVAGDDAPNLMHYAIIGVGINVNHSSFPEDLRHLATSLRLEMGIEVSRQTLLSNLLCALEEELTSLRKQDAARVPEGGLLHRFTAASTWVLGKHVKVGDVESYTGVTAGLNPEGFLRIHADDGTDRTVLSGGVRDL